MSKAKRKFTKKEKLFGVALIGIVLALILIINFAPSNMEENSEGIIQMRERLVDEFRSKYEGNWSIFWDSETNTPQVYGYYPLHDKPETYQDYVDEETFVENLARDFILENKEFLGVEDDNFILGRVQKNRNNWIIDYHQYYEDLLVYGHSGAGSNLRVVIAEDDATEDYMLDAVISHFNRDVKGISTTPQVTDFDAVESAEVEFGEEGIVEDTALVIYPAKKEDGTIDYRLAWRVELTSPNFVRWWAYFIDAETEEVLRSEQLANDLLERMI